MIFGFLSFNQSEQSGIESTSSELLNHFLFENNESETVQFQSGQVTFIRHTNLPVSQRDHCYSNEKLTVIVSGHIYNCSELSKISVNVNSQAELIANLFVESGIDIIQKINGDHVIVLLDHSNSKYYFIKNQLGTVPLTIAEKDGLIYFSSDTMGLSKALFGKDQINDQYILSRFYDYERSYQYTPHAKVRKVLPGHYLTANSDGITETKYWPKIPIKEIKTTFNEATKELDRLLNKAVDLRLNKEYVAGSHLSGGLDSSLAAVLAKNRCAHQDQFVGFTWSPKEFETTKKLDFDERENIKKQAEFSGIKVEYTDITKQDYNAFVNEWRCPSEFIYEQIVFKNAHKNGVNLIFSGWGGDEFIGVRDEGLYYETFKKLRWNAFFKLNRNKGLKSNVMHVVNNIVLPTRRKIYFRLKINPYVFRFFKKSKVINLDKDFNKEWLRTKTGYQLSLVDYYHLAQRCEDRYVHGQRNGIEYRYPFLDINLADYCLSLPVELFVDPKLDRPLIRKIAENHLVDEVRFLEKNADPVVMMNSIQIQNQAVQAYKSELQRFKENPHLSFIDFDLVEQEIKRSEIDPNSINKKLNYLLHQIKSTHEFTVQYYA